MFPSEDHSSNYNPTGHNQPGTTQMEYDAAKYSQSEINSGQRKINYALTLVDEKLAKAVEALRDAIKALPAAHNIDLEDVDKAIKDAVDTSRLVAGIQPPGCDPEWPQ